MSLPFIEDLPIKGKRVLMRVDFNVPLDGDGNVVDATRIEAALPSIRYVLNQGGSLILMSHLGRPEGEKNPEFSLLPCCRVLKGLLNQEVTLASDCIGTKVKALAEKLQPGQILLLENLRFHRAEEFPDEDPSFAKGLSELGDLYVNDAFGAAHRKHSSTYTIASYFPGKKACGYLMEKEVRLLSELLSKPTRPFCALIGGAKIGSKIGVLKSLLAKVDTLLIGGGMSYTFLKALGIEIGASLVDEKMVAYAKELLEEAEKKKKKLLLPLDFVIATSCTEEVSTRVVSKEEGIPKDHAGFDIGPKTIDLFSKELQKAKTILWNGPVGVYELKQFAQGTLAMAKSVANSSGLTIVGGGDSISALNMAEVAERITHLSTGGGATLEFIEKGSLPGVDVLLH